jgi:hypothetical protein
MKPSKLILALLLVIAGCTCNRGKDGSAEADSILVIPDTLLVYDVDAENKTMQKHTEMPDSAFTVIRVINGLNEKYPNVQLRLLKLGHDTLYVSIPASEYLGEQMGSAGAEAWYADAVLNLAAIEGVKYVNIDLEEGSHAQPGVFSNGDYAGYRIDSTLIKKPGTPAN